MIWTRGGRTASLAAIVAGTAMLVALSWLVTLSIASGRRTDAEVRVETSVADQAALFAGAVQVDLLAADEALHMLARLWEAEPDRFQLQPWRTALVLLNGISPDVFIADEHGIIRDATVPEAIGTDISDRDYFRGLAERVFDDGRMFISSSTLSPLVRPWHMNLARPLHHPDGSFAGVIVTALRLTVVSDFYRKADIGTHGLVALVGLDHGHLRFALGPNPIDPGTSIAGSAMFGAMQADPNGVWIGRTALDGVERIHGFHRVADHRIAAVVAVDRSEAMEPTRAWTFAAYVVSAAITGLLLLLAALVVRAQAAARHRDTALGHERAMLASAATELELAKARADNNSAQLEKVLAGMSDAAAIFDADMQLIRWSSRFSEAVGTSGEALRAGLSIANIMRLGSDHAGADQALMRVPHDGEWTVVLAHRLADDNAIAFRCARLEDGSVLMLCAEASRIIPADEAARLIRSANAAAVLSLPQLDKLRASVPAANLANLVEQGLTRLLARLAGLQEAARQQDWAGVRAQAHAMADMAAEYGMSGLETRLRGLAANPAASPTDDLELELQRGATALRQVLQIEMA